MQRTWFCIVIFLKSTGILQKDMPKYLYLFSSCFDHTLLIKAKPTVLPVRCLRYNKHGGLIGGRKRRLPFNWRVVNYNPLQIPSAWKPKDWDKKQQIDYEYEQELAKYTPGYKPKVPNHLKDDYHEEPLHTIVPTDDLVEGLKQSLFLTKSIIVGKGLPTRIKECAESTIIPGQDDSVIQVFRHAHLFDVDPSSIPKGKLHKMTRKHIVENFMIFPSPKRYIPLITQELIRLCQIRLCQLQDNFHKRIVAENIVSKFCVERECTSLAGHHLPNFNNKWKLQFSSEANTQLQAESTLPPFANSEEVRETMDMPLHSLYPIMPIIDIKSTNNYDFTSTTGITPSFSLQFPRTLVIYNTKLLGPSLIYSRMLTHLFSSLCSLSTKLYGATPQLLPEPLTAQCVASDGRRFQFMCLQLNTTKLDTDDGVKNMVWVDNESVLEKMCDVEETMMSPTMYSECSHGTWKSPDYYLDYDPEVFKLFQGFWLNGAL